MTLGHGHAFGLLLVVGLLAFGVHLTSFLAVPAGDENAATTFEITDDEPLGEVASRLAQEGLIRSRLYFIAFGRLTGSERALKPGEYALSPSMRPLDILERFRRGSVVLHPLTIPEGYTARQIAQALGSAGLGNPDEFLRLVADPVFIQSLGLQLPSLEGYLYPDTYAFPRKVTTDEIVRHLVARFQTVYEPEWDARAADLGMSRHKVVTLASIIEKEVGTDAERPFISAVFHNRLRLRMPLQSDPTVIYPMRNFDGNLRKVDLVRDSPYNTYRRRGLPPGPIANPGRASLAAALYPASVEYLFFVSRNNGTHYFSTSLREHNAAVDRYQRRGNPRPSPRRAVMRGVS
jgi:UPF0755 protein